MKSEIIICANRMTEAGLIEGTAGNISVRFGDARVCITPSGVEYGSVTEGDLPVVDLDGKVIEGELRPSSEIELHLACYREFQEVGAVIHSHPIYASMFAAAGMSIPACLDEFVLYVGGDVSVAEYAPSGSKELAQNSVRKLADRGAVLLANHGMVAIAPDLRRAFHITALVERTAQVAWGALQLGRVVDVPEAVLSRFGAVYRRRRLA